MWLIKGVALGLLIFFIFTLIYWRGLIGPPRTNVPTGLSVVVGAVTDPLYLLAFAFTMATSCLFAKLLHDVYQRWPV